MQEFGDKVQYIFEKAESLGDKAAVGLKTKERVIIPWAFRNNRRVAS